MGSAAVSIDPEKLRLRDAAEKLLAKAKEDLKRCAKDTAIRVEDFVFVAKGDPRYDPTPFKVIDKHCGDLELVAENGSSLKRNVTLVKKLQARPQMESQSKTGPSSEQHGSEGVIGNEEMDLQPPQQTSKRKAKVIEQPLRRSTRATRAPTYLGTYVRMLHFSPLEGNIFEQEN